MNSQNNTQSPTFWSDLKGTLSSASNKTIAFFKSKESNVLDKINAAWITPNNIGTIRLILLAIGISSFSLWQKELWTSLLALSCIGDFVDGKIAKWYWKMSKWWETFDAGIDKITDISISILSTVELTISNPWLAITNGLVWSIKLTQHYKWQFREGRPNFQWQKKNFYKCLLQDEKTKFVDTPSSGAAIDPGKYKTVLQFISTVWILWASSLDESTYQTILYIIFTWLNIGSLPLWYLSNKGK